MNEQGPLVKLLMQSAAKYQLSTEAKALLVCQAVFTVMADLFKMKVTDLEKQVRVAYRNEKIFLKANSSSLSSELHMRRMTIFNRTKKRIPPFIRCKFIVVSGLKTA